MLEDFCKYLQTEKRYSEHTVKAYRTDIAAFLEFAEIPSDKVSEVNSQLIRAWVSSLLGAKKRTTLSARSVNRKLAALRSFFNYLRREGFVQHNPLTKVTAPKIRKQLPTFFNEDKLNNYLNEKATTDNGYDNIRNLTILEVLYGTGMRVAELTALQCYDIDLSSKTIKVTGKGNKQRYIPISLHLEKVLENYLSARSEFIENRQESGLFLTSKGKQIYVKLVYLIVRAQLSKGGFTEKRSPHVLRHSFATHLLNHNADLNGIKELMGHANLGATQVYTHNSFQKMKAIYKKAHPHADKEEG